MKCINLNNYAFRPSQNNVYKKITPNKLTNNLNNNYKNKIIIKKNIKLDSKKPFIFKNISNIDNGNLSSQKISIRSLSSFQQYNFDCPTKAIKENDYSRDEDKTKSFIINKEENKLNKDNKKEKKLFINNNPEIHIKFKNLKKILKKMVYLMF